MTMEEEEEFDPAERKRLLQDLKGQVIRKVNAIQDPVLLESLLETIDDAGSDIMEGNKDPELVEAAEVDLEHPDNRKKPAPINQRYKNDADSWLDGLGR
jgi:hypothetical protein